MATTKRSDAAKAAGVQGGLHNQRRGGKSIELQDGLVKLAARLPGYTLDQLSWIAAGFHVDENGICQPSDKYNQIQKYFNCKRRGAEIAFSADELSDHPRARLVYVKAVNNPYTESGGRGVMVIGGAPRVQAVPVSTEPVVEGVVALAQEVPKEPTKPVDVKGLIGDMKGLLD